MSKDEGAVRKASEHFYSGVNKMVNGDSRALADTWSHSAGVTAMHPIGGRITGWDDVRQSFERVAQVASEGRVNLVEQAIQVDGDVAYETGVERGQATFGGKRVGIDIRVTNIYRREGSAWKIVHHHTDFSPAMVEALSHATVNT